MGYLLVGRDARGPCATNQANYKLISYVAVVSLPTKRTARFFVLFATIWNRTISQYLMSRRRDAIPSNRALSTELLIVGALKPLPDLFIFLQRFTGRRQQLECLPTTRASSCEDYVTDGATTTVIRGVMYCCVVSCGRLLAFSSWCTFRLSSVLEACDYCLSLCVPSRLVVLHSQRR